MIHACGSYTYDQKVIDEQLINSNAVDKSEKFDLIDIFHHLISYVTQPTTIFPKILSLADNFHVVESGKLYRSQQMSAQDLEKCIKTYGIKTVINLRGVNPSKKWWIEEKSVLEKHNVAFFNIPMDAHELTSKEHLLELLNIYDTASLPIIVHCKVGADRTGEAVALWMLEKQGKTKEEALKALSIDYGHNATGFPAKRFLIEIWQGRAWLEKEYESQKYHQLLMQ